MWSSTSEVWCGGATAIACALKSTRRGRDSGTTACPRLGKTTGNFSPPQRNLAIGRAPRRTKIRASANDDDPAGSDKAYYDTWAKYPDDPSVPSEISQLLREVGDGEVSMWSEKPPWCQPWTIVLTGSVIIAAPTAVFHAKWLSALVTVPIAAWWWLFLVIAPKQYVDYVDSARQYYDRR